MEQVVTVKEAAERLRLSPQTVWRYIKEGRIVARKVGRQYLIPSSEVTRLMEPQRTGEESDRGNNLPAVLPLLQMSTAGVS